MRGPGSRTWMILLVALAIVIWAMSLEHGITETAEAPAPPVLEQAPPLKGTIERAEPSPEPVVEHAAAAPTPNAKAQGFVDQADKALAAGSVLSALDQLAYALDASEPGAFRAWITEKRTRLLDLQSRHLRGERALNRGQAETALEILEPARKTVELYARGTPIDAQSRKLLSQAHHEVATVLWKKGKRLPAGRHWRKAFDLAPGHPGVNKGLDKVEKWVISRSTKLKREEQAGYFEVVRHRSKAWKLLRRLLDDKPPRSGTALNGVPGGMKIPGVRSTTTTTPR